MMEDSKQVVDSQQASEAGLDEAARVRYLGRDDFVLFRGSSGALRMTLGGEKSFLRIKTRRCFPFAYPSRYISVRDASDEEIGIIKNLAGLSKQYRRWIEDDLGMRYFTPRVTSIRQIRHRYGGVEWHLETDRGSKKIITKGIHDTMVEVEPGRYIITDVDGNRYELLHASLDQASARKLEQLV